MENWPVSVPHIVRAGSLKGSPFRAPLTTDMEDGQQRRRRSNSKNIARLEMSIYMDDVQFSTFKAWVRDVLVDGTLPFTMPVFTGSAYQVRTCSFNEQYSFDPQAAEGHIVSFAVDVEDY